MDIILRNFPHYYKNNITKDERFITYINKHASRDEKHRLTQVLFTFLYRYPDSKVDLLKFSFKINDTLINHQVLYSESPIFIRNKTLYYTLDANYIGLYGYSEKYHSLLNRIDYHHSIIKDDQKKYNEILIKIYFVYKLDIILDIKYIILNYMCYTTISASSFG